MKTTKKLNDGRIKLTKNNINDGYIREFIKKTEGETKNAYQKDLLKLYDEWLINFPAYNGRSIVGQIMSNKAQKMIDYKLASKNEIFTLFEDAYQRNLSYQYPLLCPALLNQSKPFHFP